MTGNITCTIMVIEFVGDFVVHAQNAQVNFDAGDTSANVAITEIDISKSILFPRGFVSPDNVDPTIYKSYSDLEDSTHVRARRHASGNVLYVMSTVIEFI